MNAIAQTRSERALVPSFSPEALAVPGLGCQVWRERRTRILRPEASSPFDRRRYAWDVIESARAEAFVRLHHYSGSFPADRLSVGLFGARCGTRAQLVGVATFSQPMNESVVPRHCGVSAARGVELGRLVLLDGDVAPVNAESFFVARALETLAREMPQIEAVVSYCDPVPRHTAEGGCVMVGHYGATYQASNARFVGRSAARTLHMLPDGTVLSPRALSKIRLRERGAQPAEDRLVALGAAPRAVGQDPAEWLAKVLAGPMVRRFRHPGNYAYVFAVGSSEQRARVRQAMPAPRPFPKRAREEIFALAA